MVDAWYEPILALYGLKPDAVQEVEPAHVLLMLGKCRGCLWRTPAPPAEQSLLIPWEERLAAEGAAAIRLLAEGGSPWAVIDEHTWAMATVWEGEDLPSLRGQEDLCEVAGFIGRLRRMCHGRELAVPAGQGLNWLDSWRMRAS